MLFKSYSFHYIYNIPGVFNNRDNTLNSRTEGKVDQEVPRSLTFSQNQIFRMRKIVLILLFFRFQLNWEVELVIGSILNSINTYHY